MSNEPKWKVVVESSDNYVVTNGQLTYGFMFEDDANDLCDKLNRLEAEVERLKKEKQEIIDSKFDEIEWLQSELARCKEERLGAEEVPSFIKWHNENLWCHCIGDRFETTGGDVIPFIEVLTAFRASQQTQEGKG